VPVTVTLAGQMILGSCVSFTVTVNEQVLKLLLASKFLQVTVVVPGPKKAPLAVLDPEVNEMVNPLQLSVPVGVAYVTIAPQIPGSLLRTILDGQAIVGGCISLTVMVNEQVTEEPPPSVTRKTMVFEPLGKAEPLANPLMRVIAIPEQLSVAVGLL
jgi:hypothetical protein